MILVFYSLGNFIDMLNRVQKFSFEDQRGPIDSNFLKVPEFLLTNSNLIKSQSLNQNINMNRSQVNAEIPASTNKLNPNSNSSSLHGTQSFNYRQQKGKDLRKNNLMSSFNESTSSLPMLCQTNQAKVSDSAEQQLFISRSQSPMIIYDNEDEIRENTSCIEESCIIDNSLAGFEKSVQSMNCNQNFNESSTSFYARILEEESELITSYSDSLKINNSNLSQNYSPKNRSNSNSRISYV